MEFGLFIQGYLPGEKAHDPEAEHNAFMKEIEMVKCADQNNWKYVWLTEHHALPEYSHLSCNEAFAGYLGGVTERIHVGSGIFNLSPRVNHPVKSAEKVAMLDHLLEGRFEFGTGRGAGSHEVATFNIHDTSSTRSEWDEVIWEIPRMWEQKDYTFQGKHFQLDTPHNILPKPYTGSGHPPIWVACGSPATYQKAGEHGIGALGFTFSSVYDMAPQINAYKEGIANCSSENAVGQFVNDNLMITSAVRCTEDGQRAREQIVRKGSGYLVTLVTLYHDTFPIGPESIRWPNPPHQLDLDTVEMLINGGLLLAGTPDEVCEQMKPFAESGIDQLVFGVPNDVSYEECLEMIELFGQKVIPEFDSSPTDFRSDGFRQQAKPKFDAWQKEPPPISTIWSN